MKILFILPQIPYPPHSGGRIVTWNTVKRFAQTDDVSVVCLYHDDSELDDLKHVEEICRHAKAFRANPKWSLSILLRSMVSAWPYKAHRFYNSEMYKYIQHLLRHEMFDIIHAQNFYTAAYVNGNETAVKIHYKENVENLILKRYASRHSNLIVKWAARFEGERTRRYELYSCRKFDRILSISPIDRERLINMDSSLRVEHQSPGVDLTEYPYLDEPNGPPSVVFTGALSYYPNDRGVQSFLRHVWPIVREQHPDMQCWIVGGGPSEAVRQYHGQAGVHVTGRVESIQKYIQDALIYIVPLEIGGGIRLKILEAMASGRAIASTPIGCEGLAVIDGEHLRIAEMPEDFAAAILELAQQSELRQRLRRNARQLAAEHYDWDKVIHRQRERYRSLLPTQASPNSLDCC